MNQADNSHAQEAGRDTTVPSNPYAAASAGALADLQAASAAETPAAASTETPAAAEAAATTETPAVEAVTPEAKVETPAEPETSLKFELKVKGQTQVLTRDELIEMAQKGVDYTQKTQKVAENERQVLAAAEMLQQREREIAEFLRDPQRVTAYVQQLQQEAAVQSADPNDIPTQAQVIAQLRATQAQMQQEMDRKVAEVEQRITTKAFEAEVAEKRVGYEGELTKTISSLIEKFPVLDTYETVDLDRALRADIATKVAAKIAQFPDQAVSMEEVKALLTEAAQARATRAQDKINNHAKMAAVRQAKVVKNGIEPPGGAVAAPLAPAPVKPLKLGSPELLAQVTADITAAFKK